MCPKFNELLSWNGPTVHVSCFMLARASTKTFVSRVQKTAKNIFVSRKIRQQGHSLAEVSLYTVAIEYGTVALVMQLSLQSGVLVCGCVCVCVCVCVVDG